MHEVREVSSRDARKQWRSILDAVLKGDGDVMISRYGQPIAAIIPAHRIVRNSKAVGTLPCIECGWPLAHSIRR